VPRRPSRQLRIVSLLDELLTQFGLTSPAQEEPGEDRQGDDAALGEHDQPARPLLGARPDEHACDRHADHPHHEHVDRLCLGAEPPRARQRFDDRSPHERARDEEREVLARVEQRVLERCVVGPVQVPDDEGGSPERERDERVSEHAKPPQAGDGKQGPEQGAGESEDDQQRTDVADQQVLAHVDGERLLRREQAGGDDDDPAPEPGSLARVRRAPARAKCPNASLVGNGGS